MNKLRKILAGVDTFTKWQGYVMAPFCVTLILITLYDITGRRLGLFTAWAFDTEWFHYGFLMMLTMGYAVLKDQHVRVDLVTTRFSPRTQAILMAVSYLFFVIPFMILIVIYSWDFGMHAREVGEISLTAWAGPLWPIKMSIFIGICLMLPQCFAEAIRNIYAAIKREKL